MPWPPHRVQQQRELVPAEAGHQVPRGQAGSEALRHRPQQRVARGVAEAVVDDLEPVQVQEQHRQPVWPGPRQRAPELVHEHRAVGQAGEGVGESQAGQLLLEGLPLGHVTHVDHDPAHARLVEEVGGEDLHEAPRAVPVAHAVDHRDQGRVRARKPAVEHNARGGHIVRMDPRQGASPQQFFRVEAHEPLHGWAHVLDGGIWTEHEHEVRAVLHQGAEAPLAPAQRLHRAPPLRHIQGDALHVERCPFLIADHAPGVVHPHLTPLPRVDAVFELTHLGALRTEEMLHCMNDSLTVFRVEVGAPAPGIGHPLLRGVAQQRGDLRADIAQVAGAGLLDVHQRRQLLHQCAEAALGRAQRLLDLFAGGDIAGHAQQLAHQAGDWVGYGADGGLQPDRVPVLAQSTVGDRQRLAAVADAILDDGLDVGIVRVHKVQAVMTNHLGGFIAEQGQAGG